VDVRGRSYTLRINYRTSHQIRRQADRLLDPEIADVDGNVESRRGALSVFNGPEPEVRLFPTETDEIAAIGRFIKARIANGVAPEEIGVFVRSRDQVGRAHRGICAAGVEPTSPGTWASGSSRRRSPGNPLASMSGGGPIP
jgi:superfamily I DNA/RNA helicase